jgi:ATP-dependent DNA ligase
MSSMHLVVNPPILPMLAKRIDEIPEAGDFIFEPKWDGFRTLIFRDGEELLIQSRDAKPLNRYFPELIEPLQTQLPRQCVLDGEIVIAGNGALDFDSLQLRLHPAASRAKLLASATPASVVFFDALCDGNEDLRSEPFAIRRKRLEAMLRAAHAPLHLTPATLDRKLAQDWFSRFEGAGFDGVIAKPIGLAYEPDKRLMFKIKHERDCDCVVAGFRWHKKGEGNVGSLLLGLYDDARNLQHVGVCASFTDQKRVELTEFLEPYRKNALQHHPWKGWAEMGASGRMPGGQSRWSQGKDLSWEAVRPDLVAEVTYEHMQGPRFRHMAHFKRWRFDKPPQECTYAQLEVIPPRELMSIFSSGR